MPYESLRILFLKSFRLRIFFSLSTVTLLILNPLLAIALLASLFEDNILFSDIISKILIPFFILTVLISISGKAAPIPPLSNVSEAVCSAFLEAFFP